MPRPTLRSVLAALALAFPMAASAQGVFVPPPGDVAGAPLTGQRAHVSRELPRYGYGGVDVRRLSSGQVAAIASFLHSGRSEGDVRSLIGGVLRRGFLQRSIDRVTR